MANKALTDEDEFWAIIDELDWQALEGADRDAIQEGTDRRKAQLMHYFRDKRYVADGFPGHFAQAFHRRLREKVARVRKALKSEDANSTPMGPDSFGDLCKHIVGCGREEYQTVLDDPSVGWQRGKDHDYVECFSYVVPHDDDFDKMRPPPHVDWAKKTIGELTVFLNLKGWSKFKEDVAQPVRDKAERLIDLLELFVGWELSMETEDGEAIDADLILDRADDLRGVSEALADEANELGIGCKSLASNHKWLVWNLVSDLEFYFGTLAEEGAVLDPEQFEDDAA